MTDNTTTKTDREKFDKERRAANAMRDELSFISGLLKYDNPEVSDRIQKALDNHREEREQDLWF